MPKPRRAKSIMVLGTSSGAGKSWLTTAVCRYYARQGLRVAPYKAQNMSNNARVVAALPAGENDVAPGELARNWGGEIGSAQYFQALAARAVPDVRMNPLLLKPEKDTHSQVVLMGQVNAQLSRMDWRSRSEQVWPVVAQALDELLAENDVVVIEGAGSPAEINLRSSDIVNMRVALHANAACLLVSDIDRGGAFAHLYGTWAMLEAAEKKLIKGFVLNKFRGDAGLLAPGPQMLKDLTGVPMVATLPMWWQHGLPEEDGVFDDRSTFVAITPAAGNVGIGGGLVIGFVAGLACLWGVHGLKKMLGADDSLDVFGVHGVGGIVGALLTGVFNSPALGGPGYVADWVTATMVTTADYSIVSQVWIQAKAVLITIVWSGVVSIVAYKVVDLTLGLRVNEEDEREGLDITAHGETAYNR